MGMIKCAVHGLSPITQYCSHIGAAIDGGVYEQALFAIDGWNNPNALCSSCIVKANEVISKSREALVKVRFDFDFGDDTSEGGCTRCLAEWMVATEQGQLDDAVNEARRRDGRPSG